MSTRERILLGANVVALRDGIQNLTLEAVAEEAGLSKGGLLYHFPSKEALVAGLVDYFTERFEQLLVHGNESSAATTPSGSVEPTATSDASASSPSAVASGVPAPSASAVAKSGTPTIPTPGAFTRAFIDASFHDVAQSGQFSAGLLAAIVVNPELLEGVQRKFEGWHEQIRNDGLDPTMASLLRYAADGIWAAALLGLAPPDEPLRNRLQQLMHRLSQGGDPLV